MIDHRKIGQVTYNQIDMMKHAIGFDKGRIKGTKYRRLEPHRNYYDAGGRDIVEMKELAELGLMEEFEMFYDDRPCYRVSDDGRKFLEMVTGVEILPESD